MKRSPRPSLVTTALPALASFLAACQSSAPVHPNPPPPQIDPPPPPARDAGGPVALEPTRLDPRNLPALPMGGVPAPVTAMPPRPMPAPAPSAAAPMAAPAPMAVPAPMAGATAGLAPGLYVVHNHPPGTPCRPISQTELQQAAQRVTP